MIERGAGSGGSASLVCALVTCGTVLGLAGTDLILPAVPALPAALGGSAALAQLVLAAFVAGAGLGLLLFGELGARFDQRRLLLLSMLAYALLSWAAGRAQSLEELVALRLFQGAAGSAAAVFAPGIIRALFDPPQAVRAMAALGSIESLVPALAPLLGAWLLTFAGWRFSFDAIAIASLLVAAALALLGSAFPRVEAPRRAGGYRRLLTDAVFLRYALSQAFNLGGLLTFVFGAPAVISGAMGGTIGDFVIMQVSGIAFFIGGANFAAGLAGRFGAERTITFGTTLSAAAGLAILAYAAAGGADTLILTLLFVPLNLGLGLRGPPGFIRAIVASDGDDARASALVILAILTIAAIGTAVAAPFILIGLLPLAAVASALLVSAVLCLHLLPRIPQGEAAV